MYSINTGYSYSEPTSCSDCTNASCNLCWSAECDTDCKWCDNLCVDSCSCTERDNRHSSDSESDFNNYVHNYRNRCKRMHCINTSYCYSESTSYCDCFFSYNL